MSIKFILRRPVNFFLPAFTLIELLVVISIIALLASMSIVAVNQVRHQTTDAQRLVDMQKIETALELYYDKYGKYPDGQPNGCGNWNVGNQTLPFLQGALPGIMDSPPVDPVKTGSCYGYRYYHYVPDNPTVGVEGCPPGKSFYVLGITDLYTSNGPYPQSPGWSCPNRNWQDEMEWVTGKFEN